MASMDSKTPTSAAERVNAYVDDHAARYPHDVVGVIADLPAAYDNGLLPRRELLEDDLRALLIENKRLADRIQAGLDVIDQYDHGDCPISEHWKYSAIRKALMGEQDRDDIPAKYDALMTIAGQANASFEDES